MAAIERRPIVGAGAQNRKFALLTSAVAKRSEPDGLGNLRIALWLVGLTFIFGICALVIL